ncbi:MAG TPA: ABC transporter substrate-binding protein [Candidatus Binatia bacterium]|nr:ABC transporter substrate-binding protein [Candidatus Binatia bacterium]
MAVINFISCLLLSACLLVVSNVDALQPQKIYKVGRLSAGSPKDPLTNATYDAFRGGLRDLGWIEGSTIILENRWAGEPSANGVDLAAELVRLKVDVIVAVGSPLIQAAKQATNAIPIVMSGTGADPVAAGFVASLGRRGRNITGLSMLSTELSGKRLELLKETVANLGRVAVLRNPKFPAVAIQSKQTEEAAKSLGLQLQAWEVRTPEEIDSAFLSMSKAGLSGLVVFSDPILLERNRTSIIALARKYRIPTIYPWRNYVEEGGLASYSANLLDIHRRAATYVDKILKGAKPGDLPVEQPTKFELVINLKTAKQIGLTIPPHVLARADKVIK